MRLKDKVAVITGAGVGIGRAAAVLFAREGARLGSPSAEGRGDIAGLRRTARASDCRVAK